MNHQLEAKEEFPKMNHQLEIKNDPFTVKHAPDITQPEVKDEKEVDVGPVKKKSSADEKPTQDDDWCTELADYKHFTEFLKEADKPVLVMYKAKWCRACK